MQLLKKIKPPDETPEETIAAPSANPADAERYLREFTHLTGTELGTLLGSILGQLEFGLAQPHAALREQSMRVVIKATERAITLSRNLRYFASSAGIDVRPVDLAQLLLNTIDLVERELSSRNIHPVVTADAASYALVDEAAVRQSVLNLISFVSHSMRLGGRLLLNLRQTGSHIEITLNDSAAGQYPADLQRQLETLFTDTAAYSTEGSLLGIVVAKTLLDAQGGSLALKSTQRGGTTFHLSVPRHTQPVPRNTYRAKRRTRRIQVRMPVEVSAEKEVPFVTEIRTLGKYGGFIAVEDPQVLARLPSSTRLNLKLLYFQKEAIEIPRARVTMQFSQEHYRGIGVEFEELSDKARKVLNSILKSHFS